MHRKPFEGPVVLFAPPPDLTDLCCVNVRLESGTTVGGVTTQPKILKCREVIFTEPDIIAAPSYEQFDCFTVIMTQTLYRTGRLQTRMKKIGLQPHKPIRVNPGVYEACLRYTLLARLAPAWNKAGDWLIQGRDFLSHTGCANAVKCEVMVHSDQLYLSACASVLRLSPLQLMDLNLSQLEIHSLLYSAEHSDGELALHNAWCRVVPSLKKGRLCAVSLSIPRDSPFTCYRDIKRHWKNTYGFRLPETDDDIFYAQISFCGLGGKKFTYPNICLRSEPLQCVPRVDPKPILSAFLQDVHSKLPSACGHALRFQPQLRYPLSAVYTASQNVKGPGANLGKRSSTCSSQLLLRNPKDIVQAKAASQPTALHTLKASIFRSTDDGGKGLQTPQTLVQSQSVPSDTCPMSQPLSQSQSAPLSTGPTGGTWSQASKSLPAGSGRLQPRLHLWNDRSSTYEGDRSGNVGCVSPTVSPLSSFDGTAAAEGFARATEPASAALLKNGSSLHRNILSLHKPRHESATPHRGERDPSHQLPVPPSSLEEHSVSCDSSERLQMLGSTCQAVTPQVFKLGSAPPHSQVNCPQIQRRPAESKSGPPNLTYLGADQLQSTPSAQQRIVPVFKPKTIAVSNTKNKTATTAGAGSSQAENNSKVVPTFKPKNTTAALPIPSRPSEQRHWPAASKDMCLVSCPQVTSTTDSSMSSPTQSQPKRPVFMPRKPHTVKNVKADADPSFSTQSLAKPSPVTVAGKLKKKMMLSGCTGGFNATTPSAQMSVTKTVRENPSRCESTPPLGSVFSEALKTSQNVKAFTSTSGALKRTGENMDVEGGGEGGGEKKPRNKPRVQQDLDVEGLARADQLQKANAVTLTSWLKERGVHCKAKDKKSDLIDRVKVFLAITTSEP